MEKCVLLFLKNEIGSMVPEHSSLRWLVYFEGSLYALWRCRVHLRVVSAWGVLILQVFKQISGWWFSGLGTRYLATRLFFRSWGVMLGRISIRFDASVPSLMPSDWFGESVHVTLCYSFTVQEFCQTIIYSVLSSPSRKFVISQKFTILGHLPKGDGLLVKYSSGTWSK
jgi:hypothetical protein